MKMFIKIEDKEIEKFKMIMIFNKTLSDWNRGVKAVEKLEKEYWEFNGIQESFIKINKNEEQKKRYEIYIEKLKNYRNAQEKIDNMLQMMALELMDKYSIDVKSVESLNLYDHIDVKFIQMR